jgi:hypothetical protein
MVAMGVWLAVPRIGCGPEPGFIVSNINHARQLIMALKIFASEHGSAYPSNLGELVKTDCVERDHLEHINQYKVSVGAKPMEWVVTLDIKDSDPYNLPVVVSPIPMQSGKCILGLNDSSVRVASKKEVEDAMERLRKFREERDKKEPGAGR